MIDKSDWVWMPHPGHFIGSFDCRFHLTTKVGDHIISTVGEYFPDAPVREIMAETRGIELRGKGDDRKRDYMERIGFEEIGIRRHYETMVFKAVECVSRCCPWRAIYDGGELDMEGYNDAAEAYEGHLRLCEKWAKERSE